MDGLILQDLVVIFGLAVLVLWICNRLRLPSIVGFLCTGVISGPHGLGFAEGGPEIETLADIGIVLLLFTIGLEFSLKRLLEVRRFFFIGGTLQLVLTTLFGTSMALFFNLPWRESLLYGLLLSMSSTAIVLKAFEAQGETDTPQGRVSIGILIFQDVIAIPIMMLIPLLSYKEESVDLFVLLKLLIGLGLIALVFVAAVRIVPAILYQAAKIRSRELFLITVLTICIGVAWVAAAVGLSLAIGAFLAGLIISESEYRHEAMGNILPLQDIFSSLFFVSIGMLLDMNFVLEQPGVIALIVLSIFAIKGITGAITTLCIGFPLRIALITAIALSQIGEFAFVLVKVGIAHGIGSDYLYQQFLAVALLSMAISPALIGRSHTLTEYILRLPFLTRWQEKTCAPQDNCGEKLSNHVVVIGFGIAGKNLARAAKDTEVPYAILEMNPQIVRIERKKGEPIHFGDGTREAVLSHLNVETAKAVAIMVSAGSATHRIVSLVRKMNPYAYLIVRTRYVRDVDAMYRLGADDVIPDEFGTSIEMFMRVLHRYDIPHDRINTFAASLRREGYEMMRDLS